MITQDWIFIDDKNIFGFGELHDQTCKIISANLDGIEIGTYFAALMMKYLHVNLNCLMILATF